MAEAGGGAEESMSMEEKLVWVASSLIGPRSRFVGAEEALVVRSLVGEGEGGGFGGEAWKRRARRWGDGRMGVGGVGWALEIGVLVGASWRRLWWRRCRRCRSGIARGMCSWRWKMCCRAVAAVDDFGGW